MMTLFWFLLILVFVTPTTSLPTGTDKPKCDLVAGTKEQGYLQSFTGDIQRCPTNISDCALVGDANCRMCCVVNSSTGWPRSTKFTNFSTTTNYALTTSATLTGRPRLTKNFSTTTNYALTTSATPTGRPRLTKNFPTTTNYALTTNATLTAFVTPTTSIPTSKCGIMPGTKKRGFLQSFADDLQACPKGILDCVAVGDAETQRSCEKCCFGSPTPTKTWSTAVKTMNYTPITPTQTTQNSVFVASTTSPTVNKKECSIMPETNIQAFWQPYAEDIEPCPKVTSNCKTVGDEETQKICLKCCTANSGPERHMKNNHVTIILSVVLPFAVIAVLAFSVFYVIKRRRSQVNTSLTQGGKLLTQPLNGDSIGANPDDGPPNEKQPLFA